MKSGINGVLTKIQNTINKFIGMINNAIGTINEIPGVNISKLNKINIPKLAQGGYVKANTPQLAIIGDNKTQGEFVEPEDKLRKLISEESGNGDNSKIIELIEIIIQILRGFNFDFNLYLDSYELNKRLEKVKNKNKFATNGG